MGVFYRGNKRQGNRKLGYGMVQDIRTRYAGGATQGSLARAYGISVGQIGRIVRGESWMDAEGPVEGPEKAVPDADYFERLAKKAFAIQEEVVAERADTAQEPDGSGLARLHKEAQVMKDNGLLEFGDENEK